MRKLTNPEFLTFYNSQFKSDISISAMPSCYECSISPERRKVTVGSTVQGVRPRWEEEVPDSMINHPSPENQPQLR